MTRFLLASHRNLSRLLHSEILGSIALIYVPILACGYVLEWHTGLWFMTTGMHLAIAWLALAPWLVTRAFRTLDNLFASHKSLFLDPSEWHAMYSRQMAIFLSPRHLIFGVPWAAVTTTVIYLAYFRHAPPSVKVWAISSFAVLALISSIGFYGAYLLISLTKSILAAKIRFIPYHPDKFGGLSSIGRFTSKGALLFSSGSLVLPLAVDMIRTCTLPSRLYDVPLYLCTACFIAVIVVGFLKPLFALKRFVDPIRDDLILASRSRLDGMVNEFRSSTLSDHKLALEILMLYFIDHSRLYELKDYPLDVRLKLEIAASFVIPITVLILDKLLRS